MNYQERLKAQLVKYKFRVLGIAESGAWTHPRSGITRDYPHVLPPSALKLNIAAAYRERFWQDLEGRSEGRSPALPRDFSHLNSSQALGFNLFYPLVVDAAWARTFVHGVLDLKDAPPSRVGFEYGADADGEMRFDFSLTLADGEKIVFETRLAELVYRSGSTMKSNQRVIVVAPRGNTSLQPALRALPAENVLYLEDFLEKVKALLRGKDDVLKRHYIELRTKYLVEQ